jgi:hypothetical protein
LSKSVAAFIVNVYNIRVSLMAFYQSVWYDTYELLLVHLSLSSIHNQ